MSNVLRAKLKKLARNDKKTERQKPKEGGSKRGKGAPASPPEPSANGNPRKSSLGTDSPVHASNRPPPTSPLVMSKSTSTSHIGRRESSHSLSGTGTQPPVPTVNIGSYDVDPSLDRKGVIGITAYVQNFLAAVSSLKKAMEEADTVDDVTILGLPPSSPPSLPPSTSSQVFSNLSDLIHVAQSCLEQHPGMQSTEIKDAAKHLTTSYQSCPHQNVSTCSSCNQVIEALIDAFTKSVQEYLTGDTLPNEPPMQHHKKLHTGGLSSTNMLKGFSKVVMVDSNSSQYSDAQDTLSSEEDGADPEPLESLNDDALFVSDSLDDPTSKAMRQPLMIMSHEAQEIVDQALKSGSIEQSSTVAVVVGIAGSGKTSLISRLFREKPPDRYTSTGVANKSLRGLKRHIAMRMSCKRLSPEEILKIFASFLPAGLPKADIASLAKNFTEEEEEPEQAPSRPQPGTPDTSPPSQKSYASEIMISLVQTAQGPQKAVLIEFLHMIDTGGQPEFMEIMPSLIHNSNLTLLVLNLDQSLDDHPHFAFYEKGTPFKGPLPSIRTNKQVIRQLARTLQAKRPTHKGSQHSKVSIIATHRDCVEKKGKLPETLAAMNEEVESIFKEDELMNKILPVNLKDPDPKDEKVLEELRQRISNADIGVKAEIPLSFFMFEHEAIKYAEQKKDRKVMILSFEECVEVGARLKMSREVVKAALIYFHRHNIFLYFQHILPNLVFLAPQVPLDFVNAVVALTYRVRSGAFSIIEPKCERLCKEGTITENMLCDKSLQLSDHFIPDMYEPQDAIKLFLHICAIAPLSNEEPLDKDQPPHTPSSTLGQKSSKEREYLMMTLLQDKPENDIQKYLPSSSKVAPLVIHFDSGCVPNGCFGNTISCLISTYKWTVSRVKKRDPKCLAHNIVTLHDPRDRHPVPVTMVNYTRHLEIHINTDNVEEKHLGEICSSIRKTIFEAIKVKVFKLMRFEYLQVKPAFLCPCTCDPSHVATICGDPNIVSEDSDMMCSNKDMIQGRLQEKHLFWFQDQLQNLEPKPIKLNEAYEDLVGISHKWHDLGLRLELEKGTLEVIESNYLKNAQRCLSEMLSTWLKVEPRATWHTLCAALRSRTVGEEKLANDLEAKYICKNSCT